MLLAVLVYTEALEVDVSSRAELRFNGSRDVDGRLHAQLRDTTFHDAELEGDDTRHFDCSTERDFTISLTEVQVSYTEFGTLDMHREEYLGSAGQVLDVAVTTMLGSTRNRPCAFTANLLFQLARRSTSVYVLWAWRLGNGAVQVCVRSDELAFALVPCV